MEQTTTFKLQLEYFLNDKKIIFSQEIDSNGLTKTTTIIGSDRVSETTINGRVLSGESTINGITSGYQYIYDNEGVAIDLKAINPDISINDSANAINNFKNSNEFLKVKMNGVLAINNSANLIYSPSNQFSIYKEVKSITGSDVSIYFLQQQYTCLDKTSQIKNEEETYQINDYFFSFIREFENDKATTYCCIDDIEEENISNDHPIYIKAKSIIDQLTPLKNLLESNPKTYRDLKTEIKDECIKKTIR